MSFLKNADGDRIRLGLHERERIMSRRRAAGARWVSFAVAAGILQPAKTQTCVDCGEPAFCYDHRDYSKPDVVEPVCKRCDCKRGPALPYPFDGLSDDRWLKRQRLPGVA